MPPSPSPATTQIAMLPNSLLRGKRRAPHLPLGVGSLTVCVVHEIPEGQEDDRGGRAGASSSGGTAAFTASHRWLPVSGDRAGEDEGEGPVEVREGGVSVVGRGHVCKESGDDALHLEHLRT